MSIPVNFSNLILTGYPTNNLNESYAPASLLDANFSYLMANVTSNVYSYTTNTVVTFGSLNVFNITASSYAYLPIANSNNANPAVIMVSNSSTSTATLNVSPNGNSSNVVLGVTTISPSTTVLYISDGANTFYSVGSAPISTPISVANGGTGATTAAGAQTNLNVPAVPVSIVDGGTGATTAAGAQTNLNVPAVPVAITQGGTGATTLAQAQTNLGITNFLNSNYGQIFYNQYIYTASTQLTVANLGSINIYGGLAAATFTLPLSSTFGSLMGASLIIFNNNTGSTNYKVSIVPSSGDTLFGYPTILWGVDNGHNSQVVWEGSYWIVLRDDQL